MIKKEIYLNMTLPFINNCKKAREENKVTRKEIAKELGYSVENIRKFEIGKNNNLTIACYYMYRFGVDPYEVEVIEDGC